MKISEMELPQHLYTKTTSPCGTDTKYSIPADKLVSWANEGRGDAINGLCHTVYERNLASINAWESDRMVELEDDLRKAGDGVDIHSRKYVNVKRHPTIREDVTKEAEIKRANAKERLAEHQTALEKLVQEARSCHRSPLRTGRGRYAPIPAYPWRHRCFCLLPTPLATGSWCISKRLISVPIGCLAELNPALIYPWSQVRVLVGPTISHKIHQPMALTRDLGPWSKP